MTQKREIKELTKSQMGIADEIDRLLLKLYKAGVRPMQIFGSSGHEGLYFVRCSKDALDSVVDAYLENEDIKIGDFEYKLEDFVYHPKNSSKYCITNILT